jgi:hypothetical protein
MRRGPAASVRTRRPWTATGHMRKPGWFSSWGTPLIEATLQPRSREGFRREQGTAIKPTRAPEARTAAA